MTLPIGDRNDYIGTGTVDTYSYEYRIVSDEHLKVTVRDLVNVETTLLVDVDFTVTGVGDESGGTIVLTAGNLALDFLISIRRKLPLRQDTDLRNQGESYLDSLENTYDISRMIDQQQQNDIDSSMRLPETATGIDTVLPIPEANTVLGWAADEKSLENKSVADISVTFIPDTAGNGGKVLAANPGGTALEYISTVGGFVNLVVSEKTANYTVLGGDAGSMLVANSTSSIDFTLPLITGVNQLFMFENINVGVANFIPTGGATVEVSSLAEGESIFFFGDLTNTKWQVLSNDIAGAGLSRGTNGLGVSLTTASGLRFEDQVNFHANYDSDINGTFGDGVLTGTGTGAPTIASGKLNLQGGGLKSVVYAGLGNADMPTQTGALRFKYTPNYSGVPASNFAMFTIAQASASNLNLIQLHHDTSQQVAITINDSAGTTIVVSDFGVWSQNQGQEYEFELNWDLDNGSTELFIDGAQQGGTLTETGRRDKDIGLLGIGRDRDGTMFSEAEFDDVILFSNVQHTIPYTPSATFQRYGDLTLTEDGVKNTHIDFGSGAGQVDADDIPESSRLFLRDSGMSAFLSSDQAIPAAGAGDVIVFNSEVYDKNLEYDNLTGVFTIKQPGRYIVTAIIYISSTTANASQLRLRENGNIVWTRDNLGFVNLTFFISHVTDSLSIGDTIDFQFDEGAGGAGTIHGGPLTGNDTSRVQINYMGS